jgi:hypothetical protein
MKRPLRAIFVAFLLSLTLLISACAPAPYMMATLTQLPHVGTPSTSTPFPTLPPHPTMTPSLIPTALEGAATDSASTENLTQPSLEATAKDTTSQAAVTPPAACPPFAFDTTLPDPQNPEQYIGRHFDSNYPPDGLKILSAGLLENHSYSLMSVKAQDRDMLWIEKLVCRDTRGAPYWEIADALTPPSLDGNKQEVVASLCFQGERQIPFVIAYGHYDPSKPASTVIKDYKGWPVQVEKAWEMNEKFIPLGTESLTCVLEENQTAP